MAIKVYPYRSEYIGPYEMSETLRAALRGKSVEEQVEYFRFTYDYRVAKITSYDLPAHGQYGELIKPTDLDIFLGAVVDGDIVVGMKLKCTGSEETCLVGQSRCYYSASDNNGAGYKTCEKYIHLVSIAR